MTGAPPWIAAALVAPLALLLACAWAKARAAIPALLWLAPAPALAAALLGDQAPLILGGAGFAPVFVLDPPGRILLTGGALLWMIAGAYAPAALRGRGDIGGFVVCWLMTLLGCVGVFLAADLISFYLLLAVLSIGASGLVLQGEGPGVLRAGAVYLGIALLAEAFLLAALVLLAAATPHASLLIADAARSLSASPTRDITLTLLILGLGMKAGLVPFHVWMPLAYGAAPVSAAAVMSGAVVKASLLAMIRFLPFGAALPDFGLPLAGVGLFGAFYGVAIGVGQSDPKVVLAYSSVSQMGFLASIIGFGLALGEGSAPLAAAFYGLNHMLVKGALFLAVGVVAVTGRRRAGLWLGLAGLLGLSLAGLPLSGGALAKGVAKGVMGAGLAGALSTASSVTSSLLMIHFVVCLRRSAADLSDAAAPLAMRASWLAAAAAAIVAPWAIYSLFSLGSPTEALSVKSLWSGAWPILLGAALWAAIRRGVARFPRAPVGDLIVIVGPLTTGAVTLGMGLERLDGLVRRWTVASIALLATALLLGWAMLTP